MECSLELAQVGQQRRNLRSVVLVDPMQPDQRIQNEQVRLAYLDGVAEPFPVLRCVQAKRRVGTALGAIHFSREGYFEFGTGWTGPAYVAVVDAAISYPGMAWRLR